MNLSQFIKEQCGNILVQEGIRSRDIEKATGLIKNYLLRRKIYTIPVTSTCIIDNQRYIGVKVFNERNEGAMFLWNVGDTMNIVGVGFTADFNSLMVDMMMPDLRMMWDIYVEAKGTNVVQMCKLVERVLTGKVPMEVNSIRAEILDSQLFESVEDPLLEAVKDPKILDLEKRKTALYHKIYNAKKKGQDYTEFEEEYTQVLQDLANLKLTVRKKVMVQSAPDKEIEDKQNNFFKAIEATPEERFDDMKHYVYNVLKGIRPLALLCGAPGMGKSYRVMDAIKKSGKEMGVDYMLMKGKMTPAALFTTLHDFKEPGQIVVMDDCDSVFKDPDAVNLLKAAFDSSDERWITWGTASSIPMPEDKAEMCDDAVWTNGGWRYPKEFLYKGGGIIITNYSAGQIDTAIRSRALICNLAFNNEEIIEIIRGIAPHIQPDIITDTAKEKALNYIKNLAEQDAPIEISIRSFTLCAQLYTSDCPDRQIERMIQEQLSLMALRGGKKY